VVHDREQEMARLEARCEEDAGAFAALAEAHRRHGEYEAAERAAREAIRRRPDCRDAHLVLSLVLFDQGRLNESRRELEELAARVHAAFAPEPELATEISDGELDEAFASAAPEADPVIDADRIAQEALSEAEATVGDLAARPHSRFATQTMANLLASQGDTRAASRVRQVIGGEDAGAATGSGWDWGQAPGGPGEASRRSERLERLETWLENLRGGRS